MQNDVKATRAAEAERFLADHPGITHISIIVVDNCGVLRGKLLTREELVSVYKNGRYLPGSFRVLDVTGEDVPETGMVWEDGDADRLALPVPGSLRTTPWLDEPQGQFLSTLH